MRFRLNLLKFIQIKQELEFKIQRKVDLLTRESIWDNQLRAGANPKVLIDFGNLPDFAFQFKGELKISSRTDSLFSAQMGQSQWFPENQRCTTNFG